MSNIMENTYIIEVLIDTWWNVNREDCHTLILTDTVLIDTWWNVNVHVVNRFC